MDPNFFHLDLERAFEAFLAIVLLSLIVERGLALIFEHRWYIKRFDKKGLKEFIAFGAAIYLCRYWQFDAVSIIILQETNSWPGYCLTAGAIAGGSKGSVALFHDFLGIKSTAEEAREKRAEASAGQPSEMPEAKDKQ